MSWAEEVIYVSPFNHPNAFVDVANAMGWFVCVAGNSVQSTTRIKQVTASENSESLC
ncbi:hypothetical protein FC17_GL002909 [Secundilactobacillus paracollinoides DSM 15502 = JCM 11969]|nr:hypothetical protein FC17_GL002909 [Secundilactobacillus paracollinoides DSM 15502 = JCM 11969]